MSQTTPGAGTAAPNAGTGARPPRNGSRPFGAIVSSILDGIRSLFRKEIELAKIEVTEAISVRAKGAGLMAGAAVIALLALVFLAAGGAAALDLVLPRWAAHLIVGGVFALIALVLLLAGRRAIKTAPKPERTQETLKEDARWAKQQIAR